MLREQKTPKEFSPQGIRPGCPAAALLVLLDNQVAIDIEDLPEELDDIKIVPEDAVVLDADQKAVNIDDVVLDGDQKAVDIDAVILQDGQVAEVRWRFA